MAAVRLNERRNQLPVAVNVCPDLADGNFGLPKKVIPDGNRDDLDRSVKNSVEGSRNGVVCVRHALKNRAGSCLCQQLKQIKRHGPQNTSDQHTDEPAKRNALFARGHARDTDTLSLIHI